MSTKTSQEAEMHGGGAGLLCRFARDENAATAIEYALIAAGIGTVIASTIWALGGDLKTNWYDKLAAMF